MRVFVFLACLAALVVGGVWAPVRANEAAAADRADTVETADPQIAAEIRALYLAFAEAQNARDPARVGAFFIDGPEFLWVSDGKSFWGRDEVLARMSRFQKAAVWRVEPDLDASTVIQTGPETAILHFPLTLVIGAAEQPTRLGFLVSIVFSKPDGAWRIAALLTTRQKA